ncbi:hypothetical protein ESCO107199_17145 [Escherichia coli]
MTSLKTSIKTITYLSDIGCLEIQGASLEGGWNFYQYPLNPISGIDPLGISHLFIQYNFRYAFVCFRYTM